ncbi:hypothetical protein [Variovorax sp. E3]|uniref:hypothetical protein n=1 Tax=Variovorax sp. E3 TaxID=1914993 RepID=UPI0018DB265C|nr:hypothetical protein [Variovorax sp. E3]
MKNDARERPLKLQLNNSGAWKDVVHFDGADETEAERVLEAATTLGDLDTGNVTFRVVTEDAYPEVVTSWSKHFGWRTAVPR